MGAIVIADSISAAGIRLSTLLITTPYRAVITGTDFSSSPAVATIPEQAGIELPTVLPDIHHALGASDPTPVAGDGLHLPFVHEHETRHHTPSNQAMLAVARVDRLGQSHGYTADLAHYQDLISADPPRMTALEHVCLPGHQPASAFDGWTQLRHLFVHRGVEWM